VIRLNLIVEGQTEEAFVRDTIGPHLAAFGIVTSARCVETGRSRGRIHKGGGGAYHRVRADIVRWTKEDHGNDARFTTMLDLYALPDDFPGYVSSTGFPDPYARVAALENSLALDIGEWRFIPYIQLHEFETLLFADPSKIADFHGDASGGVAGLVALAEKIGNPELIDDGPDTAPSKRIIQCIPRHGALKAVAGPIIARAIGTDTMREACQHFGEWLGKLERLQAS
jgi:hypothetical protein